MALSLRFPSPEVIWHRVLIEPGLSSLVYSTKATNQLSGTRFTKQKKPLNQEFFKVFLVGFQQLLDILYQQDRLSVPVYNVFICYTSFNNP